MDKSRIDLYVEAQTRKIFDCESEGVNIKKTQWCCAISGCSKRASARKACP